MALAAFVCQSGARAATVIEFPSAAAASSRHERAASEAPPADAGSMPAAGSISIADPVGSVTIALAADLIGERRYADAFARGPAKVVVFSRTPRAVAGQAATGGSPPRGSPVAGAALTSGFGMRLHPILGRYMLHKGLDLAAPSGTPVVSTMDGRVAFAGWAGGYGLSVKIAGGGALETRYAHLSRLAVAAGQVVHRGEVIGFVGSTGRSTGPHLHYEVLHNGRALNPDESRIDSSAQ